MSTNTSMDFIQILGIIKNTIGEKEWASKISSNDTKLNILDAFSKNMSPNNPITIVNAINLLTELSIVTHPNNTYALNLLQKIIPSDTLLTAKSLVNLILNMALKHPKINSAKRSEVIGILEAVDKIPDGLVSTSEFIHFCSNSLLDEKQKPEHHKK